MADKEAVEERQGDALKKGEKRILSRQNYFLLIIQPHLRNAKGREGDASECSGTATFSQRRKLSSANF